MGKKAIRLLLCILIAFGVAFPLQTAFADVIEYTIEDGVYLLFDTSTGEITGFQNETGVPKDIVIPSQIEGIDVTAIGQYAFNSKSISSVTIPATVTSIKDSAFAGCDGLTSFTIPGNVKSIGYGAFSGCENITSLTIEDGVEVIGERTFADCEELASVDIPQSVTSIGYNPFKSCNSLTAINVAPGNQYYESRDGLLLDKDKTLIQFPFGINGSYSLPYGITGIGSFSFAHYDNTLHLTLPESVTEIEAKAFEFCGGLKSISLPDSLRTIGWNSFYGSGLTSLTIPAGVTAIEKEAFLNCSSLTSLTISEGVTGVKEGAFSECYGLTSVTIPASITNIPTKMFSKCNYLTSITISDGVSTIGDNAFEYCNNLISITIPESVMAIRSQSFSNCNNLTTVLMPGNYTSFSYNSFLNHNASLTIYGYSGTVPEQCAISNNINFEAIDGGKITTQITSAVYDTVNDAVDVNVSISNSLGIAVDGRIIVAVAKQNGSIAGIKIDDIRINTENTKYYSFPLPDNEQYNVKVYLWKNSNEMRPICATDEKAVS